jgi:hypothetical protein
MPASASSSSASSSRHRRRPPAPRTDQPAANRHKPRSPRPAVKELTFDNIVLVHGDDRAPNVVMFPVPAVATVSDKELWTPKRLHGYLDR